MSVQDKILKRLTENIRKQPKTSPYDTTAKVVRIEDGVCWVHIDGGAAETPVRMTVNAAEGDVVQVRIGGGDAWITGNGTAPPTDDKIANAAHSAAKKAATAAGNAQDTADEAMRAAARAAEQMANAVVQINSDIADLQSQIDGNVTSWFYDYDPTLQNLPASEWIAEGTESVHLGDTFYNTDNGYAYRWMSDGATPPTYSWQRIADTDVTQALAMAAAAQDTADSKRRVFVTTPTPPYDVGDLWFTGGSGDILTCLTAKAEGGSYAASDWSKMNKYTDDTRADQAWNYANTAKGAADAAQLSANAAATAASNAQTSANNAATAASNAQTSADNAGEYAVRALGNLSTVQSVVETLNWITQHGTMTLTTDTAIDPTHVYFVQDAGGDYVVGGTHYSIVREPVAADLSTYYVLSIDESLQNYVGTHLAVTDEGLWVLPAATGYKVLIATGNGTTYTTAGTYIIDAVGNIVARFGETTQIGENGKTRVEVDYHSLKLIDRRNETYFHLSDLRDAYGRLAVEDSFIADGHTRVFDLSYNASNTDYTVTVSDSSGGVAHTAIMNFLFDTAPTEGAIITATYYTTSYDAKAITFGTRLSGTVGGMSVAIGTANIASNRRSIAIGMRNSATGQGAVAIGRDCKATGEEAFAIGYETEATHHAVAQNQGTKASSLWQTAMGSYNIEDKAGKYVLIIGNGDADIRRSNAYAVTFNGDEHLALNTSAASGTVDGDLYAAITALGWGSEVIV